MAYLVLDLRWPGMNTHRHTRCDCPGASLLIWRPILRDFISCPTGLQTKIVAGYRISYRRETIDRRPAGIAAVRSLLVRPGGGPGCDELASLGAAVEPLRSLSNSADLLSRAALVLAGYHQHDRGEWRRRRHDKHAHDKAG